MSEFLLGDYSARLFHLMQALEDFSKDEFLEAYPDACLLQIPVEGAFAELSGEGSAVESTQKVAVKDVLEAKRSRRVDDARLHFLVAKEGGLVVGRIPECDVVLDHSGVSRRHAELHKVLGNWLVVDAGSNNGTYVDKQKIAVGEKAPLKKRTQLWFGSYRTMFLFAEDVYDLAATLRRGKQG